VHVAAPAADHCPAGHASGRPVMPAGQAKPAGHDRQPASGEPAEDQLPAAQGCSPSAGVHTWLAAHATHPEAAEAAEATVPKGQSWHANAPPRAKVLPVQGTGATVGSAHEWPAGHRAHVVLPATSAVVPGAQRVHEVEAAVETLPASQRAGGSFGAQKEPAVHAVHREAPAALVHPSGQGVQLEAPAALNVPAPHWPSTLLESQELPAGQMVHESLSVVYHPFGHAWHAAAPAAAKDPSAQGVHSLGLAPKLACVPAGHSSGASLGRGHCVPAGQGRHAVLPASGAKVPSTHTEQVDEESAPTAELAEPAEQATGGEQAPGQ